MYFKGIAHPTILKILLKEEEILTSFQKEINPFSEKPFLNIPTHICKKYNFKIGDLKIIRITKNNQTYEFIKKLGEWGRVNIPKEIIPLLSLKDKEKVIIQVIKESKIEESNKSLSLILKNTNFKILGRNEGFITIYKEKMTPITIYNKISQDPDLIKAIFLIHGDGHYKTKLSFTNTDIGLHKFIIKIFEKHQIISKKEWKGRISINENQNQKGLSKYWSNVLNPNQFYPTISKTRFNTKQNGNFRIVIDKRIVGFLINIILEHYIKNLDQNSSFYALNGLLAAEGSADLSKKGLHRITLSYNSTEKELFKKILCKTEILELCKDTIKSKSHGMFVIENWNNIVPFFQKFISKKLLPFDIHEERRERALRGFVNHQYTITLNKYLKCIQKENTISKIANNLKIRKDSCLSSIKKERFNQLIIIKGKGINRNPFKISITKEGNNFLELTKYLKGEIKP